MTDRRRLTTALRVWGRRARLGLGLALLAAGLSTPAVAQRADGAGRPDTLTAEAAVGRALAANPTVEARRQGRRAAAASVREARGEWFPTLRGTARYRRLSDNVDYTVDLPSLPGGGGQPVTFAPAILNRYSVRAGVEQPLFTGFRVPNQLEAARARRGAARAQVETTRQAVAYETRTAYWRLYEARSRAEAAADALRLIERRLVDVRNRRGQGMATEADVLRVRARRDRVRVERVRAQSAVQAARRALNEQMGRPVDAPVVLADTVRVGVATVDSTGLVARARAQRPDLEVLRATVRARAAEVDVAQSSWYPQVSLTGSYLYARPNEQLFPPEERFEGTWEAGVRLSWHLSLGRQTDAAVDRARARRLEARYELRDRRRSAAVEVKTQVEAVAQAREAVRAAQTSVQSARAAYRSVQSRYDEGMVPVSDLLDAEQALRRSRARLATAQADLARARAALDRALGRDVPR